MYLNEIKMTFLFCLSVYLFVCHFCLFLCKSFCLFVCLFVRSLPVFHSFALACETEVHGSHSSEIWPGISVPTSCLYEAARVVGRPEPIYKTKKIRNFFFMPVTIHEAYMYT